jgi:hypothetical protein
MGTMSPNTSLLGAKNASPSDLTPAPLTGPSSAVQFAFQGLQPPSALYVNVDDQLIISAASSQSAEIVTVNVRLLLPNGRLEDMQFFVKPANTRAVLKTSFPLAEGFILSMSAAAAVAVTRGQTFARVALQRAAGGAGQPAYCLMADYVTTQAVPGFPNGRILSPSEGPGNCYNFIGSVPVAGNESTVILPLNVRWRIRAAQAKLTTSATAGNRLVHVNISGVTSVFWTAGALVSQAASLGYTYDFAGITPYTPNDPLYNVVPIPADCVVTQNSALNWTFATFTGGILAGDQWTALNILVEEWLDNV